MADRSPDDTSRRQFLAQALGMVGVMSCDVTAPVRAATQGDEDAPNTHNMLLAGTESVFVSHLPMFQRLDRSKTAFISPHRYQAIAEVSFTSDDKPVSDLYRKDQLAHPDVRFYTVGPLENFVLTRLFPVDSSEPSVRSFSARVFRGHLEHEAPVVPGLDGITVTVNRIVHARRFDPRAAKPQQLEYLLFGTPGDLMLAHTISQPPDFDHVIQIAASGTTLSAADLNGDVRVVFPERKNVARERAREMQKLHGMLRRASQRGRDAPVDVEVTRQLYFEEGELLVPPTFEPTPEEKKGL